MPSSSETNSMISPKSGYKVQYCKVCHRKRRVWVTRSVEFKLKTRDYWTCSHGHTWKRIRGSIEAFNRVLKRFYLGPVREKLNKSSVLFDRLNEPDCKHSGPHGENQCPCEMEGDC